MFKEKNKMLEISATGKTGRTTRVTLDGTDLRGVTKIIIHPLTNNSLLTADLSIFANSVSFQGELNRLTVRHLDGSKRVFENMKEVTDDGVQIPE